MEPYIANAQSRRRQDILDKRLDDRLCAICVPEILNVLGGNDMPLAQSMTRAQLNNIRLREPQLISRKTEFLARVILERCKQAMFEQQQRQKEASLMARDHFKASQPTETELLRRTMKSEIISRFSQLTEALRREDRMQTGTLSPNKIRMMCRQFNLESPTLDNAIAKCYLDTSGGNSIQYGPLIEILMKTDYGDLFNDQPGQGGGGSGEAQGSEDGSKIFVGRSSLRMRKDGPAGSPRIRPVPVDEWAMLTKTNNAMADEFERQDLERKKNQEYQYGKQLRSFAKVKKTQETQYQQTQKVREREEVDRKLREYQEEERKKQERLAQLELQAWEEGNTAIREKRDAAQNAKNLEYNEAMARVAKENDAVEKEYLDGMRRKQDERERWKESLVWNQMEDKKKAAALEQEREDDFIRQEEYAEMLEKEVSFFDCFVLFCVVLFFFYFLFFYFLFFLHVLM